MKVFYVLKALPNQLRLLVPNQQTHVPNVEAKKQSASSLQEKSEESASSLQEKSGESVSSVQEKCTESVSNTSKVSPEVLETLNDSKSQFRCKICEIILFNKAYFLDHWKKYHPEVAEFDRSNSTISIKNGESESRIRCNICDKLLYCKSASYHRRKFHPSTIRKKNTLNYLRKKKIVKVTALSTQEGTEESSLPSQEKDELVQPVSKENSSEELPTDHDPSTKVSLEVLETLIDSISKFCCGICKIILFNKTYFLDHWKKYHPEISEFHKSNSTISIPKNNPSLKFHCTICNKTFYSKSSHYYHRKKLHPSTIFPKKQCKLSLPEVPEVAATPLQDGESETSLSKEKHLEELLTLNLLIHKFFCEICEIIFINKGDFLNHWKKYHPGASELNKFDKQTVSIPNMDGSENSSKSFVRVYCPICQKTLSKAAYYTHRRRFHQNQTLAKPATIPKLFPCDQCNRGYSQKVHLSRHKVECHNAVYKDFGKVTCVLCKDKIIKKEYSNHALNIHNINVHTEELKFASLDEFDKWKESIEQSTKSKFHQERSSTAKRIYYICHRSGFFTTEGKRLRNCKAQGSKKINGYCPAALNVYKLEDGSCEVKYTETHVGHDNTLSHLTLTKKDRQFLAAKIAAQVPFDTIIEEVRKSAESENDLQRIHIIKRKDLHNIAQLHKLPITYELQVKRPRARRTKKPKVSHNSVSNENESEAVNATTMLENLYYEGGVCSDPMDVEHFEEVVEFNVSEERDKRIQKMTSVINSLSTAEEFQNFDKFMAAFEEEFNANRLNNEVQIQNFFDSLKN